MPADPFHDPAGPAPVSDPRFDPAPPADDRRPRGRRGCGVGAALAAGAVLGLLCCGGGTGLFFLGMGALEGEILDDLAGNPVLNERLGGLTDVETRFVDSARVDGEETFVFTLTGPDGAGRATLDTYETDDGVTHVKAGTLRLPDGAEYDLFPEQEVDAR